MKTIRIAACGLMLLLGYGLQTRAQNQALPRHAGFSGKVRSHLLEFQATRLWKSVELSWKMDINLTEDVTFTIERSKDGEYFQKISSMRVEAESGQTFTYIDPNPRLQQCFYRLHIRYASGEEFTTKPLYTQLYNNPVLAMMSVTPNSRDKDIEVNVQLKENAYVVMRLLNLQGEEILLKKGKMFAGNSRHQLDGTRTLAKGTYVLEVSVNQSELLRMQLIKGS